MGGGIEKCTFEQQVFHLVRVETGLESKNISSQAGYYDLTITGSAKSVIIEEGAYFRYIQ